MHRCLNRQQSSFSLDLQVKLSSVDEHKNYVGDFNGQQCEK